MSLAPGARLGPYEILAPLGAGGMGEVYRAKDTKLKREVALKVLPEAFAADPERMARFQREAEVLASLNHTNIAQIYGVEERAIAMELVEGESPRGPMPFEDAWKIASQMAAGLEYAHDRGIVHRDLKPANVKITPDGVVKLLDFGLAKAFTGPTAASGNLENSPTLTLGATQIGVILGTAAYMAPEQAKGKNVDKRADIWSFGVVLYELLTGERLFTGDDVSETLADVLKKQPDLSKVPPQARRLLRECLEKDPKLRLRDIGDARRLVTEELPVAAVAPAPARSRLPWAVAAVAFVAGAVLAFVHFREKPPVREVVRFQIYSPDKTTYGSAPPLLSPDGRMLAFTAAGPSGDSQIWVRSLDTLEARALPDTKGASRDLFWSPDSRSLAFEAGEPLMLKRVDVAGGPAQTLCATEGVVASGAWSPAGVIVLPHRNGLMRVPAAGGACTALTVVDGSRGETTHRHASFLPDGRHFLYMRPSTHAELSGVYIGSLDARPETQDRRRLLPLETRSRGAVFVPVPDSQLAYLLFMRESVLMAQPFDPRRLNLAGDAVPVAENVGIPGLAVGASFSVSATGALAYRTGPSLGAGGQQFTIFNRQGKVLATPGDPGLYEGPAFSPDGAQLAFGRLDLAAGSGDIWLHEFARGTSTRFTFDPAPDRYPVWSPDGKQIAFGSTREGPSNLYLKVSNNAGKEALLLKTGNAKVPTDWSRDGRYLLFSNTGAKTGEDIWYLPLVPEKPSQERKPVPYLTTEFNETEGRFSPDTRFVAYRSFASGMPEIYVQPFPDPSGGKWMVSKGGGSEPHWRRDGKELLYAKANTIMSVDVTLSPVFHAGIPKELFRISVRASTFDVSGDGQRFIVAMPPSAATETAPEPVTVVLNWQAALRK